MMDTLEEALELLKKKVLNIHGVTGLGVVDYGDGKKIEIGVTSDNVAKEIERITKDAYFSKFPISVVDTGENTLL